MVDCHSLLLVIIPFNDWWTSIIVYHIVDYHSPIFPISNHDYLLYDHWIWVYYQPLIYVITTHYQPLLITIHHYGWWSFPIITHDPPRYYITIDGYILIHFATSPRSGAPHRARLAAAWCGSEGRLVLGVHDLNEPLNLDWLKLLAVVGWFMMKLVMKLVVGWMAVVDELLINGWWIDYGWLMVD